MNEGLLKAELNNLAAFFNDETAYIHVPDEIYNSSKEDTWTTFLNAYLSNEPEKYGILYWKAVTAGLPG